jgi:hypothetical protein
MSTPVPLYLYVRIQKILIPQAPRSRLTIYQSLRPDESGIYATLSRLKEPDMYGCATVLVLRTFPSSSSQLSFIITQSVPTTDDLEFARLVLPLVWFRVNRVVSYSYPMIARVAETQPPMMLIDVHLSHQTIAPFGCPLAPLKVVPTWEVPPSMQPPAAPVQVAKEGEESEKPMATSLIPPEAESWLKANLERDS